MIDLEKRRRVMARSRALGHCICDPQQPCPCPALRERNLCHCAGEREEQPAAGPVALTALVRNAGCASKVNQRDLGRMLAGLPACEDPRVLVGAAAGDDAGVFELEGGRCLVQTVDVFTPCVDDPYEFGQIAAANSLSDIYAMGGTPLCALSIVGLPTDRLGVEVAGRMLAGGVAKMAEAGVAVIGGHSINDPEVKCGFAVTGLIEKEGIVAKGAPRAGDRLVLTKPLGTGVITFAGQIGRASKEWQQAASESMRTLNAAAARVMVQVGVSGCTDVTGFGLVGHLANMLEGSELGARIEWSRVPFLPGVVELAGQGVLPGGIERNREAAAGRWEAGEGVSEAMCDLLFDAQTSGGLLLAVAPEQVEALMAGLQAAGCRAAEIGEVAGGGKIRIENTGGARLEENECCQQAEEQAAACCQGEESCCQADTADQAAAAFADFMAAANQPGAIDAASKKLMAVALSVLARCEPCARVRVKGAREMGIGEEAINEAVWLAVAFGGAPVLMWYRRLGLSSL